MQRFKYLKKHKYVFERTQKYTVLQNLSNKIKNPVFLTSTTAIFIKKKTL